MKSKAAHGCLTTHSLIIKQPVLFFLQVLQLLLLSSLADEVIFGCVNIILLNYVLLPIFDYQIGLASLVLCLFILILHLLDFLHAYRLPNFDLDFIVQFSLLVQCAPIIRVVIPTSEIGYLCPYLSKRSKKRLRRYT